MLRLQRRSCSFSGNDACFSHLIIIWTASIIVGVSFFSQFLASVPSNKRCPMPSTPLRFFFPFPASPSFPPLCLQGFLPHFLRSVYLVAAIPCAHGEPLQGSPFVLALTVCRPFFLSGSSHLRFLPVRTLLSNPLGVNYADSLPSANWLCPTVPPPKSLSKSSYLTSPLSPFFPAIIPHCYYPSLPALKVLLTAAFLLRSPQPPSVRCFFFHRLEPFPIRLPPFIWGLTELSSTLSPFPFHHLASRVMPSSEKLRSPNPLPWTAGVILESFSSLALSLLFCGTPEF